MVLLFISGQEIIMVLALALIFFGAKSIPDIARMMGKGVREFRKATNEIQREFDEATSDVKKDINEVNKKLDKDTLDIKRNINKNLKV